MVTGFYLGMNFSFAAQVAWVMYSLGAGGRGVWVFCWGLWFVFFFLLLT